jgi:hypothetical protein
LSNGREGGAQAGQSRCALSASHGVERSTQQKTRGCGVHMVAHLLLFPASSLSFSWQDAVGALYYLLQSQGPALAARAAAKAAAKAAALEAAEEAEEALAVTEAALDAAESAMAAAEEATRAAARMRGAALEAAAVVAAARAQVAAAAAAVGEAGASEGAGGDADLARDVVAAAEHEAGQTAAAAADAALAAFRCVWPCCAGLVRSTSMYRFKLWLNFVTKQLCIPEHDQHVNVKARHPWWQAAHVAGLDVLLVLLLGMWCDTAGRVRLPTTRRFWLRRLLRMPRAPPPRRARPCSPCAPRPPCLAARAGLRVAAAAARARPSSVRALPCCGRCRWALTALARSHGPPAGGPSLPRSWSLYRRCTHACKGAHGFHGSHEQPASFGVAPRCLHSKYRLAVRVCLCRPASCDLLARRHRAGRW